MRYAIAALALLVSPSAAFASQPGQPLDCSDWVFLQPGLTCATLAPFQGDNPPVFWKGVQKEVDNTGSLYTLREPFGPASSLWRTGDGRLDLVRSDGVSDTVVAYVADRGGPCAGCVDHVRPTDGASDFKHSETLTFDRVNGRFILAIESFCASESAYFCGPGWDYDGWSLIAIGGFATLFDVLQTYTPPAPSLGFRVPYMPDGLRSADHFDTYTGSLTKPIDFTQAQPLQCAYPLSAPHVGDYLTIADPLPDPAPGTGRYYITATTYQGQTRFGRKTTAGKLSGRDPSLLPACVAP
jgi:hypothetical protein